MSRRATLLVLSLGVLLIAAAPASPVTIVICAPGYPGNTESAQPVLDDFGGAVTAAAGWPAGRLSAVYHQTLEDGLARLEQPDAAVAIVGLPFFLDHREALGLEPLLAVAPDAGAEEQWSLVVPKGTVQSAADLAGWRVASLAGYSPRFVERVALAGWGPLPADAEVAFTKRVLGELRKAARGENVAVLLDRAQAGALDSLPFAADLEVVHRSEPHVASLLCSVKGRLGPEVAGTLGATLREFGAAADQREVLDAIQIHGFDAVDSAAVAAIERLHGDGG